MRPEPPDAGMAVTAPPCGERRADVPGLVQEVSQLVRVQGEPKDGAHDLPHVIRVGRVVGDEADPRPRSVPAVAVEVRLRGPWDRCRCVSPAQACEEPASTSALAVLRGRFPSGVALQELLRHAA